MQYKVSFDSFAHAAASVLHDVVKVEKVLEHVLEVVQGNETAVEAVTSVLDPSALPIERAAFAILGLALQAMKAADAAAGQGFSVPVDANLANDLKAILQAAENELKKLGVKF